MHWLYCPVPVYANLMCSAKCLACFCKLLRVSRTQSLNGRKMLNNTIRAEVEIMSYFWDRFERRLFAERIFHVYSLRIVFYLKKIPYLKKAISIFTDIYNHSLEHFCNIEFVSVNIVPLSTIISASALWARLQGNCIAFFINLAMNKSTHTNTVSKIHVWVELGNITNTRKRKRRKESKNNFC
jgi:hypothetical protein